MIGRRAKNRLAGEHQEHQRRQEAQRRDPQGPTGQLRIPGRHRGDESLRQLTG